jgi:hypothetical protein
MIDHKAHRAFFVMRTHENDGAVKTRVAQTRHGEKKFSREAVFGITTHKASKPEPKRKVKTRKLSLSA